MRTEKTDRTEKSNGTTVTAIVAPPPAPAPSPPAPKKRIRNRSAAAPAIPGGPGPVSASEGAVARIDELVNGLLARTRDLLEAQRSKPARWEYFAALADLEERLRRVLP